MLEVTALRMLRALSALALCAAALALLAADARAQAQPSRRPAGEGARSLLGISVERDIVYATPGGVEVRLDAYRPEGEGTFPAVVVIHGGSWRHGKKEQLAVHAFAFARAGMAAFAIEYRLAPEHRWPAQLEDCLAAVRWVRANAAARGVDPSRVAAFGYSAGGHLAALLGLRSAGDAQVVAVVAGGAPLDLTGAPPRSTWFADWLGATREDRPDIYRDASPMTHDAGGAAPMLFFNGGLDLLVSREEAARMSARLEGAGVPAERLVLPGLGHMTAPADPRAIARSIEFLRARLGTPATPARTVERAGGPKEF